MDKIIYWFIRKFIVSSGPIMVQKRDYWIFVDYYGQMWKLSYTGQHDIPFSITLIER